MRLKSGQSVYATPLTKLDFFFPTASFADAAAAGNRVAGIGGLKGR